MALVLRNRVQETTTTTGTGSLSLGGAATGYQAFGSALSNGDTTYYQVTDGTDWEIGLGTYDSGNDELARTTVFESSNSNNKVDWGAGSKDVFIVMPAEAVHSASAYGAILDLPVVGNTIGAQAVVTANNSLYIWTGSGWFKIATINQTPTVSGNNASYSLNSDGTPTVITLTGSDPEGFALTWDHVATGLDNEATITNVDNVFTITPSTNSANGGTFSVTFRASDGVNIGTASSSFTLEFVSANWRYVNLSLGTNSTNALANSTFVDRSTNGRTITNNGTPAQTAFHPYLENWSVYFDGNGDFLTLGSAVDFSTGDFTVEGWVFFEDDNVDYVIVSGSDTGDMDIRRFSDGSLRLGRISVQWDTFTGPLNLANEWHHVAFVRQSGTASIYVDGVAQSVTGASNTNDYQDLVYVGRNTTIYSKGYYSNIRISNIARYTANFTSSSQKLTSDSDTLYLVCQSNRFIDNSSNNHAITPTGNALISSSNPFGQESDYAAGENKGSVVLEGSTSYLKFPVTSFTGDYTLECWVYKRDGDKAQVWGAVYPTDGNFQWFIETNDKLDIYPSSMPSASSIKRNAWNHIVFQRRSGTLEFFINGVKDTITLSNDTTSRNLSAVGGSGLGQLDGYIADARATIGSAVYTADFTPPASPVGNTSAYVYIPMDNAGIFDKSGNRNVTVIGADTYTDTSIKKYSASSIAYRGVDNNSSGLLVPSSAIAGLGDWTIEFWVYHTDVTPGHSIVYFDARNGGANDGLTPGIYLFESGGSYFLGYYVNTAYQIQSTNNPFSINTWYHISVCRSSGSTKMFIDGTQVGSTYTDTTNYVAQPAYIGRRYISTGTSPTFYGTLPGNLEGLQILNGVAKYTANFTPPAAEQGRTYQAGS